MLYSMNDLLNNAFNDKYAIPQPDFVNLSMAATLIRTAAELNSPIILGFGEDYIKSSGATDLRHLVKIIDTLAQGYRTPIVLHLDHGSSYDICAKAINAGFTSVMIDGSMLPLEENIALTKKVAELAKLSNVSVEGELGTLETGSGYDLSKVNDNVQNLTNPETAKKFVQETNVDALAISIGNVHGNYQGKPNINIQLLQDIKSATNIPLVLHGASGISYDILKECSENGICKVNIFTDFTNAINKVGRNVFSGDDLVQITHLIDKMDFAISNKLKDYINVLGSANTQDFVVQS